MLNHLCLSVKKHSSSLTKVLTRVKEVSHAVVMERFSNILKNINTINDDALGGFEEKLLWMEEGFGHSLDLFVIMVINFATVVKHITKIRDRESHLIDGLCALLV